MLVPKEQTTFESYTPERYSKCKRYTKEGEFFTILSKPTIDKLRRICKNCHQPYGSHGNAISRRQICPTTYILQ